ncbi:MAG: flagellar hook-basal body complex protein [Peptococcaceae bacterium]|nr:flagellar hook-basal body complex protein [Candidatus Syntrophopropionicum ammoniitolerans]
MIRGLYCSTAAIDIQQARVEGISNNLANVSTPGFKQEYMQVQSFPEALLVQMGGPNHRLPVPGKHQGIGFAGMGSLVAEVHTDQGSGDIQETGKATDMALRGPGFFVVNLPPMAGSPAGLGYSRNGAFRTDAEGYLTTGGGHRVLGEGGPIRVEDRDFRVGPDGIIEAGGSVVDRLWLVEFANRDRLRRQGADMFVDFRGEAGANRAVMTTVSQGRLERSNVNVVDQMAGLLAVMRSFEANQRIIQAYDEQLAKAVNQVGSLR